jgi:hypothetical protein
MRKAHLSIPIYWKSKFAGFVQSYGVENLARSLEITPPAIYHWIRGRSSPKPEHAAIIQRLARERGASLSFEEIYGHATDVRASNPSIRVEIEQRKEKRERKEAERAAAVEVLVKRFVPSAGARKLVTSEARSS